jgi:hypothetical protein
VRDGADSWRGVGNEITTASCTGVSASAGPTDVSVGAETGGSDVIGVSLTGGRFVTACGSGNSRRSASSVSSAGCD